MVRGGGVCNDFPPPAYRQQLQAQWPPRGPFSLPCLQPPRLPLLSFLAPTTSPPPYTAHL